MYGTGRIRVGVAIHAAVNLIFGVAAVAPVVAAGATASDEGPAQRIALDQVLFGGGAHTADRLLAHVTATTTTLPPTSTSTTTAPVTVTVPASPSPEVQLTAGHSEAATVDGRRVSSTGYCLAGTTASGQPASPGGVAMNGVPIGSQWVVHDGPLAGAVLTVNDRIGSGSDFDIWFETCEAALGYGRRSITVERIA